MLIATPNLCLDRTQFVSQLVPGAVMRALSVQVTAGGKGVNIARVARAVQHPATLVGLVADRDRDRLLTLLHDEGAEVVDVAMPGDARMAMIMIEQPGGRSTVLNEPGSTLDAETWERYVEAVRTNLPHHRTLACSGSLPPGVPEAGYGQLVELAHEAGALALVDTAPAPLRASLPSGPDLVSPNLQEAEAAISGAAGSVLADADQDVRERAIEAAVTLCRLGSRNAAVTAGAHGVALAEGPSGRVRWFASVPVEVVSTVGAGDSFLAGVIVDLERDTAAGTVDWGAAVLRGSATASASCEQLRAGGVDRERIEELLATLRVPAAGQPETTRRMS